MIHIFYPALGEDSAKTLSNHLTALGAKATLQYAKDGEFAKEKGDLCVNWGSHKAKKFGDKAKWLNKSVVLNKLLHLKQMKAAGVSTVEFVVGPKPSSGVWYGRQLKHWDGSDLEQSLTSADFWVKHVEIKEEYRVHCFKGQILRASLKVPVEKWEWRGKTYEGKAHPKFKIGDFWGTSSYDYQKEIPKLCKVAAEAVKAVGYDFGGVDVCLLAGGDPVVLEVNSAPWLGGDAADKYAKLIIKEAQ